MYQYLEKKKKRLLQVSKCRNSKIKTTKSIISILHIKIVQELGASQFKV